MSDKKSNVNVVETATEAKDAEPRPYLVPFKFAIHELGLNGDVPDQFKITREQLSAFVTTLLRGVKIDEQWYLAKYPDIDQAIKRGDIASAREHFVSYGYREGRHAVPVKVDEGFYLSTYPDIAEGIQLEDFRSAQEHFDRHGRDEGRFPYRV